VWNTDYFWSIDIRQTTNEDKWYYIANANKGPLFEISNMGGQFTRLYWAKKFMSSELNYDVEKYEKHFMEIVKWVKKNSIEKIDEGFNHYLYVLE
jgi:hypothetical protein